MTDDKLAENRAKILNALDEIRSNPGHATLTAKQLASDLNIPIEEVNAALKFLVSASQLIKHIPDSPAYYAITNNGIAKLEGKWK